jgi:hypothetical protein
VTSESGRANGNALSCAGLVENKRDKQAGKARGVRVSDGNMTRASTQRPLG